jgi:hypothetical protein
MGQTEIQKLLEIASKPLLTREICIILNCNQKKISEDLGKMIKHKEIEYVELNKDESFKKYGCKHKLRFYFMKKHPEVKIKIGSS